MRHVRLVSLVVLATAFAGCTGDDGGPSDSDSTPTAGFQPEGTDTNSTTSATNTTGTTAGNGTAGDGNTSAQASWRFENRTGSAPGTLLPIDEADAAEESFSVDDGAMQLRVEVGVTGDDATVRVAPPGCTEDACMMTGNASEGTPAGFDVAGPDIGQWLVEIAAQPGLLTNGSSYEVAFGQLVGSAGNATMTTSATNTTSPP